MTNSQLELDENFAALALAILYPSQLTPEQAFLRLEFGNCQPNRYTRGAEADDDAREMAQMREEGYSYQEIGETFNLSADAVFKRLDRAGLRPTVT